MRTILICVLSALSFLAPGFAQDTVGWRTNGTGRYPEADPPTDWGPEKNVVWRHVTSNALIPVITVVGLELGTLLSGSIIVETVFSWPGSGSLLITGLNARDYPLVTGLVMTYTAAFVIINLIIDALYAVVDPRIRY